MPEQEGTLYAIGNAHIDPVWLWRWTEGVETIRATFRSALDRMRETPDFVFTDSSAAFYAMVQQVDPALLEEIRERVAEGRWEIVGGWWVQPDANIPCGESLVRQSLQGQRWFERAFNLRATVGFNPDTFGHPGSLPQILRGAGITSYTFLRPGPHEKELPGSVFRWRSPDGSEVLAARIARAYCSWSDDLAEHVRAADHARPPYLRDYVVFYGVGNHGGGPTRANIASLHRLGEDAKAPSIRMGRLDRFFRSVAEEVHGGADVPVVEDELQHHARGCYSAHSEVKRENRRVEHLLLAAERVASVAAALGARDYPLADLREAWRGVLFNQFHDILAGTSLPEAYADARDVYGHAATLGGRALHFGAQAVTGRIDTRGEGEAVVVWNPLPWPVQAPVEIERGGHRLCSAGGTRITAQAIVPTTIAGQRRVCFVANLPALGYRLYRQTGDIREARLEGSLEAGAAFLQTDRWRIEVDPATGDIARIVDRRHGVEALSGPGNALIVLDDPSDTWSHDVAAFRSELGRFRDPTIVLEENGPVRACLRIDRRWGASSATQRIYLYRNSEVIELRLSVNWQEQLRALKLAFPLGLSEPVATAETPYGTMARATGGEEEPCQQWVDVTGIAARSDGGTLRYGVALLNDSKYGYDVLGSEMRLTVLRSPAYAHHDPQRLDPERAPLWIDQGWQSLTCRLVPHAGGWAEAGVPRLAWELNEPPFAVNEFEHDGDLPTRASFASVSPASVLITAIKGAEDGSRDVIVRLHETAGEPTVCRVETPYLGRHTEVRLGAHEIATLRVRLDDGWTVTRCDLLERPLSG
ncbi:MAG TPA: glycoside hydrolase family 38 C-terminal domain-containing protein [Chthonomonadales bacterium]|nr:glycoside hydrolase family 38 C-terminal domain-containing protein [Chthonomonadales bacterium]